MKLEMEELGTCKSAVEAFANVMAVAIDVPEVQLHYWLDCYYQLRRAYEAERQAARVAESAVPEEEKTPEPKKPAVEITERVEAKPLEQIKPQPAPISFTGKKASMKQEAHTKLLAARARGVTFSELSLASNCLLSEGEIMSMVNAAPMTDRKWEIMAGALEHLEKRWRTNGGGA